MKRGQLDVEFLFTLGIIVFVILLLGVLNIDRVKELADTTQELSKEAECLEAVDFISTVHASGEGAQIPAHFDHLLTIENRTRIVVQDVREIVQIEEDLAFLASDCGPTSESFFDDLNVTLTPDNYGVCYRCGGSGCPGWYSDKGIADTLDTLMTNINSYSVLYLEDPTLDYRDYKDVLESWVAGGNSLVLSEHVFCHYTFWDFWDYTCSYPEGWGDDWEAFDVEIHQEGGNYGNIVDIVLNDPAYLLTVGEELDFEEDTWIENINASGFTVIGEYESNGEAAIAHWSFGKGHVYYFGDFQVDMITYPGNSFSDVIINLVDVVSSILLPGTPGDTDCLLPVPIYDTQFTGDVLITNVNGFVEVTNATG